MTRWMEGCPCHMTTFNMATRSTQKKVAKLFPVTGRCPASGCRVPEIAADGLEEGLQELLASCTTSLHEQLRDMQEGSRDIILADLQAAQSYLECGIRLKFDAYRRLPWQLAGLAHCRQEKRQVIAARCLALYDQSLADGFAPAQHHEVTRKFLQGSIDTHNVTHCDPKRFRLPLLVGVKHCVSSWLPSP